MTDVSEKYGVGKHPNSLRNLKPRRKGDPPLPGAGRPRRPLTDRTERILERSLSRSADGRKLRSELGLSSRATWGDALAETKVRRAMKDENSYSDLRDAIEGCPTQRQQISTDEAGPLQITVIREEGLKKA